MQIDFCEVSLLNVEVKILNRVIEMICIIGSYLSTSLE